MLIVRVLRLSLGRFTKLFMVQQLLLPMFLGYRGAFVFQSSRIPMALYYRSASLLRSSIRVHQFQLRSVLVRSLDSSTRSLVYVLIGLPVLRWSDGLGDLGAFCFLRIVHDLHLIERSDVCLE